MPITLDQIPPVSWLRLAVGIIIFLGPGQLLLTFSTFKKELNGSFSFVVSFGYSVALWAILLGFTNLLNIRISSGTVITLFLLCWVACIWMRRFWKKPIRKNSFSKESLFQLILWLFLAIIFIIRLWIVRHESAGLGSDSYHHTLITQMIMDQGGIPKDYGSGYPIITFTYHYGFHATAAFLGWVSGIPTRLLLLIVGYVMVVLCSVAVGFTAEKMVGTKLAGMVATILTAGFFVFPSFMLLWGRYTQMTGLTLMTVFIGLFWLWIKGGYSKSGIVELGILAAGTGLTHYRIVALTAVGVLVIAVVTMLGKEFRDFSRWKTMLVRGALLILIALTCSAPWLIHLWQASLVGHPIVSAPPEELYFSLDRFEPEVIHFPFNTISFIIFGISLLAGWFTKNKIVIALSLWSIIVLIPSRNSILLDTISVIISLFVPIGIIMAWGISTVNEKINNGKTFIAIKKVFAPLLLLTLAIASIAGILNFPTPLYSFLYPSDIRAFEYIDEHVPTDAKFMVNLNRFSFSDILMVGNDGGYWIPLLTKRQSVAPPMTFTAEKVSDLTYPDRLRAMERLNSQLTSEEGLEMLDKENITHVYIGERGGPINPAELLNSQYFELVYEDGPVYVFEYNK